MLEKDNVYVSVPDPDKWHVTDCDIMDEVIPEPEDMSPVPEAILEIAHKGRPHAASAWHKIKHSKLERTGQ